MNDMILRAVAWVMAFGLALAGPGMPAAWAQLEAGALRECHEIIANDPTIEPAIRDIALNDVIPAIESDPDGPEAKTVEATAEAIRGATETTQQALANPNEVVNATVAALEVNGVPSTVTATVDTQLRDALTKVQAELARGGTLADADVQKYLGDCKSAFEACRGYVPDFEKAFAAQGRSVELMGSIAERPVFEACLTDHFRDTIRSGVETSGAPPPEALERMMACGISPGDVFRGGGEFGAPPKEVFDAMTPEQRAGYEAWKSGDFARVQEMMVADAIKAGMEAGMSPEAMQRELAHMEQMRTMEAAYRAGTPMEDAMREMAHNEAMYREVMEKYIDPRAETSGASTGTFETGFSSSSPASGEALVAAHDHNNDGMFDEFHYDVNSDGIADHAHATPH